MRVFKTILIVIGLYAAALFMEFVMVASSPDYEGGIIVVVILLFLAFMSPRVGYRWFDCFFAAIPFFGIVYIFRIAYRLAYLPQVDWSVRDPK
jgi:hypothetical protein